MSDELSGRELRLRMPRLTTTLVIGSIWQDLLVYLLVLVVVSG